MIIHACTVFPGAGKEWPAEKIGELIAAARPMKMHVCGMLPTAGEQLAAKKSVGLLLRGALWLFRCRYTKLRIRRLTIS